MPWVTINVLEGHSEAKMKTLHETVARAVYESLGIPADWVKVQVIKMTPSDHSIGGVLLSDLEKNR